MQTRVRISQIVGDPKQGIPAMIPVGKSTIYKWVTEKRFPAPAVQLPGVTWWDMEDIEAWIAEQSRQRGANK